MVSIQIDNAEFSIHTLKGLTANNQSEFHWKQSIIRKIEHAVIRERLCNVWRDIPSFPKYEISGGGLIRDKKTREYLPMVCEYDEPIMVKLDDRNGWELQVWLEHILFAAFPELEEIS